MKWLIFGSRGWIGGQVLEHLRRERPDDEIVETGVRADDEDAVAALFDAEAPDRVVSLIGRTHGPGFTTIDYLEQKGKLVENVKDNLYGPLVLASECAKRSIHFTYLGTGCIFTYDNQQHKCPGGGQTHGEGQDETGTDAPSVGFSEADRPNFFGSSYSTVKGFTDRMLSKFFPGTLNVRIRMPITADRHPRNFITKITSYAKICSIPNSMTVLPELLPIMLDMAARKVTGTVNLTNPGAISHNEILGMYREIVDPAFAWSNFSQEEQRAILASERSNNLLETSRLNELYPAVRPIGVAVRAVLEEMKSRHGA